MSENECKEIFDLFDGDKDNSITLKELEEVLKAIGISLEKYQMDEIVEEFVNKTTNKIDYNNFQILYNKVSSSSQVNSESLLEIFRMFDYDNDGKIPLEEMKHLMKNFGENLKEEDMNEYLKDADLDCDGFVKYKKFVEVCVRRGFKM